MRSRHAAMVMGAVSLLLGCARAASTEEMVRDALEQANVGEVAVNAEDGTLRLSGTVDTLADRSRAEELALAIAGRNADVRNEIAVTGLGPLRRGTAEGATK